MRYIFTFGDSLTRGVGESPLLGWTGRLRKYVESQQESYRFYNLGIDAEPSTSLLKRYTTECLTRLTQKTETDSCVMIFQSGIFDTQIYDKMPLHSLQTYRETMSALIKDAKKITNNIVILGLLPVDEDEVFQNHQLEFSNELIADYNDILAAVSKEQDVLFIDFFSSWEHINYELFLVDGLHPIDEGYEILYEKLLDSLLKHNYISKKEEPLDQLDTLF